MRFELQGAPPPKPPADRNARIDHQVDEFVKSKASSYAESFNDILRRLLELDTARFGWSSPLGLEPNRHESTERQHERPALVPRGRSAFCGPRGQVAGQSVRTVGTAGEPPVGSGSVGPGRARMPAERRQEAPSVGRPPGGMPGGTAAGMPPRGWGRGPRRPARVRAAGCG